MHSFSTPVDPLSSFKRRRFPSRKRAVISSVFPAVSVAWIVISGRVLSRMANRITLFLSVTKELQCLCVN